MVYFRFWRHRLLKTVLRVTTILAYTPALIFLSYQVFCSCEVFAQDGKRKNPKNLDDGASIFDTDPYEFKAGATMNKIVGTSTNADIYDSLSIANLRRMQEAAQPAGAPGDLDPDRTRRIVERALAIQVGRTVTRTLNGSELRSSYQAMLSSFKAIHDTFRLSVQKDAKAYSVRRSDKGKKIVELNLEFNLKQGIDPQIRLGESFRFRYDYLDKRPILEYGFSF